MGTVEVLGMPLLTSAVDQQIEETATMKKNAVSYLHKRHVKNSIHNKYSEIHQKENAQFHTLSKTNPLRN
jgi:hypothetical protein